MTYNIRNARGLDNRIDLERVADVISAFEPHLLALQEVDVARARSGTIDQAERLADRLGMRAIFAPCIETGCERYGIATLARLPVIEQRQLALPYRPHRRRSEPRCALLTRHLWDDVEVDLVNTHLSTLPGDRPAQVATIVDQVAGTHLVIAGDFNCTPWSGAFRALRRDLRSATRARTWPSRFPILPLDHILCRGLAVVRAGAWTIGDARVASDHLPVFAELARGAA
jgi:endonuclease/exonuclease/phosphatase family metal-dependent hydrolase